MKTLQFNGESYEAQTIVKQADSIIGYNGNAEVFSFRGASDFTLFQLGLGQVYDIDADTELVSAITNSTTLEELKKALTGTNGNLARVKGKLK